MNESERIINPKRVTAENSVCIKKSPSYVASSNISVASNLAANGEDAGSYQITAGSQAAESAKTWFDDSNKNVTSERGTRFYADDDPPFFLRNKSSSDDSMPLPNKMGPSASAAFFKRFPNAASLLSRNQTVDSSSEDFRSVIDDLTVENRKLRKKLRRYEQVHCGDLQGDKLFELRVHGLPASKKRKLEKALQEFASSLGDTVDDELPSAFAEKLAKVPARRPPLHHNASSSGTSNSRTFGDSAYASMSNSSNAHISRGESSRGAVVAPANDQTVRAYLQNLSRGLLPKHPPVLTEKTKKQVVVQRLEQLFTGSRDSSGKDSQSKQQQEVSQSAASADRKSTEAQGHRVKAEGRRESKIFASEEELKTGVKGSTLDRADTDSSESSTSTVATPDQRPTRPLDLDPSRAQVPEDNIEYMKHLGFESPRMQAEKTFTEDEGWIYLNLLIGMAQLHILNVTTEFVRNAVRDISTQFELSVDGTRIRWKGGKKPTLMTSDSGEASAHSSNYSYDLAVPQTDNSKSSKSAENQSGSGSGNNQSSHDPVSSYRYNAFDRHRPMLLGQTNVVDPHQYRPLFYHDNRSDDSGGHSYDDDKDSSLSSGVLDSTKLGPDGTTRGGNTNMIVSRSKLRRAADPIIFYNNAKFYTDLSKDDESMPYNCPLYTKNVKSIIGMEDSSDTSDQEDKGPLSKRNQENPTPQLDRLDGLPTLHGLGDDTQLAPAGKVLGSRNTVPFEASGIGGVVPGDNFAIDVEVQLQRQEADKKVATKILSSRTTEMLPSNLPPPSYAFLPFSSSSESDDGAGSDSDSDVEMVDDDAYEQDIKSYIPPKFLNSFSSGESSEDAEEDDDMSDDSSIDMLAHARETEPETVAAAEREFEDNISSRDEDEKVYVAPPASSIVATLGDQSLEKDETTTEMVGVESSSATKLEAGKKLPSTTRGNRSRDNGKVSGKPKQRRTRG